MIQDLSAAKPWRDVDGPSLVRAAAALQLLPENIQRLVRLQRLAAIGAALPARPEAPRMSPSRLRSLLKDPLVSGPNVRSGEDPYDDLYTAEVPFHGGPHLVAQGLTSRSAHTAGLLLRSIFAPVGDALPTEYREDANLLTLVLLRLSHTMCVAAGLRRGIAPPESKTGEVFVPGETRLNQLRQAVTFDFAALAALLPGAAIPVVRRLSVAVAEHPLKLDSGSDDGLIVTPLLATGDGIVIANPGELASALRHHLILLAAEHGCRDQLAQAFRQQVVEQTSQLLALFGAEPIGPADNTDDPLITRRRFTMAGDKFIDLAVVTDDLSGYSVDEPFGPWDVTKLGERVQDLIDPPGDVPEDSQTLRLIVNEGVGRSIFLGLQKRRRTGPMLMVLLEDLRVMIELDGGDPLFLWRFAQADNRLHDEVQVLSWSKLDNYAIYRDNDRSYYLGDDRKPNVLSVDVASALPLRIEAQRRIDRHEVRSPHKPSYIEVLALYGSSTAPIYFTHPRYVEHEVLVELENVDIWFGVAHLVDADLNDLGNTVVEALAYWTWQISKLQPGLLRAAGPSGRLNVNVVFDDTGKWKAVLAGTMPQSQASSWIRADSPDEDRLRLRLSADGAHLLLSSDNNADRLLVHALLTLLTDAAGDHTLNLVQLVDDLAPPGPKKMLRSITAHEVPLRPGQLPHAERRLQRGWRRPGQRGVQRPGRRWPAGVAQAGDAQYADDRAGVGDLAAEHHRDRLVQRYPVGGHAGLLVLAGVPVGLRYLGEVAGQVDPDHLGRVPGRAVQVEQQLPAGRDEVDLLGQLAGCRRGQFLPLDVDQPGRQLPELLAERMPVLADQDQPVLVVDRRDGHRADVDDIVPLGRPAARHRDLVGHHREDPPAELLVPGQDPVLVRHRAASLSSTGSGRSIGRRSASA